MVRSVTPRRILFLSCHLPYPPTSGGRRREYELITRLARQHAVYLCCLCKTFDEDIRQADALRARGIDVALFRAAGDARAANSVLPADCPPQVLRHASAEATRSIARLLETQPFDLIHVEGYYLLQHVPRDCDIPIVLGEQNVEYLLYQQRLAVAETEEERLAWRRAVELTVYWERTAWRRADLCVAVTEDDRDAMLQIEPALDIRVVPDGCDHTTQVTGSPEPTITRPPNGSQPRPTVLSVGNFGYEPNVDAALYLVREIFPRIRRAIPAARLVLAGNAPPPAIQAFACGDDIVVTGFVPSLEPYFAAADIVVCPLRIGGGVKVKLLEALVRGKAIVSTSVGVQGLGEAANRAVVVRDDPHAFALAATRLLVQPTERLRWEMAARDFARTLPTWDQAAAALMTCYDQVRDYSRRSVSLPPPDQEVAAT